MRGVFFSKCHRSDWAMSSGGQKGTRRRLCEKLQSRRLIAASLSGIGSGHGSQNGAADPAIKQIPCVNLADAA